MFIGSISNCNVNLFLNNNLLPVVDKVKDLGVIVDSQSKLSFVSHVDQTAARVFIQANLIHKCFVSCGVASLTRAFTVYVRPLYLNMHVVYGRLIKLAELIKYKPCRENLLNDCQD